MLKREQSRAEHRGPLHYQVCLTYGLRAMQSCGNMNAALQKIVNLLQYDFLLRFFRNSIMQFLSDNFVSDNIVLLCQRLHMPAKCVDLASSFKRE